MLKYDEVLGKGFEMSVNEKYSKEDSRFLKVGLLVSLMIVLVVSFYALRAEKVEHKGSDKHYPVRAVFGRTDGLSVGDTVRMAGLDVGRVTKANLDGRFHAVLTLEIKDNVKIPDDSSASIVSVGVLGPKYIEIDAGGSEDFLEADGEFSYTQDAMVLEELVDRLISIGKANRSSKKQENN